MRFLKHYVLIAAVAFHSAAAIADDDEDIAITEDLFNTPVDFSDANAIAGTGPTLWPNSSAIPYHISYTFNQSERQVILKTLRTMERMTNRCVLFKPRTEEYDYLSFTSRDYSGCTANVGRTFGEQYLTLGNPSYGAINPCFDAKNIQRLVMRALGFDFEHKRPDRDQYVEVRNVSLNSDFDSEHYTINPSMYTFGTKYDYHSILQQQGFMGSSSIRVPVTIPKKGLITHMGQRERLSATDVAKIMIAYKCPLNITRASKQADNESDFPNFSREPMTDEECSSQFNRYCQSDVTTIYNCTTRTDFRIVCRSNATISVLRRMSVDMAEKPLRVVSMDVGEELIAKYSFVPLKSQIVKLQMRNCTTERATSRLNALNFTNLLDFQLNDCRNLSIEKEDFSSSKRLRVVVFYNTTVKTMQVDSFADLPDLQILSPEALSDNQKYYNFDNSFRSFLHNLHCTCAFAWYRSWWKTNKQLRLRVSVGEVYSFDGIYLDEHLESAEFRKEDLYHPINCHADPFPFGPEWINYYTQMEYSVNAPLCHERIISGSNASRNTTGKALKWHSQPLRQL